MRILKDKFALVNKRNRKTITSILQKKYKMANFSLKWITHEEIGKG